jgi:hypothetical protein
MASSPLAFLLALLADWSGAMLMKTFEIFRDRVEYSRTGDGSWKAEFHGAVDVVVEASSLERCRRDALDVLDEQLAEWIVGPVKVAPSALGPRSA